MVDVLEGYQVSGTVVCQVWCTVYVLIRFWVIGVQGYAAPNDSTSSDGPINVVWIDFRAAHVPSYTTPTAKTSSSLHKRARQCRVYTNKFCAKLTI